MVPSVNNACLWGLGLWRKHVYGTFSGSDAVTENITHRAFAKMGGGSKNFVISIFYALV